MSRRQRSQTGWLVVGLLLLSSALTMVQLGIISQSYGQLGTQTTRPPGPPTTSNIHPENQSWTWSHTENQSWTWTPTANQSRTWIHTANQTWTHPGNQTWTQTGPPEIPGNQTRKRGGVPPGLVNGWAHSNMSIGAKNATQPIFINGTDRVRLASMVINASSGDQIIRNIAFNQSVAQVEFDHDGSVQLIINSSAKPARIFADNMELSEAQSLNGLTPESEAWVYDQSSHTLIIFADPSSITIIYGSATTPIPEFPAELGLVLVGCLAVTLMIAKNARSSAPRSTGKF